MCTHSFGWHKNATPDIFSFIFFTVVRCVCMCVYWVCVCTFLLAILYRVCVYHFTVLLFFRKEKKYHQNYNMYFAIIKIYTYISLLCLYVSAPSFKCTKKKSARERRTDRKKNWNSTTIIIIFYFGGRINRNYTHVMYQIFIKMEWNKAGGMGYRIMYTF